MKKYYFHSRFDSNKENIGYCIALSRYQAATFFASRKRLALKSFLALYSVSR